MWTKSDQSKYRDHGDSNGHDVSMAFVEAGHNSYLGLCRLIRALLV